MPTSYKNVNNLKVAEDLLLFVNNELLKDTGISTEKFWQGFDKIIHELAPENRKLIKIRTIHYSMTIRIIYRLNLGTYSTATNCLYRLIQRNSLQHKFRN